jgi:hypothetical protein
MSQTTTGDEPFDAIKSEEQNGTTTTPHLEPEQPLDEAEQGDGEGDKEETESAEVEDEEEMQAGASDAAPAAVDSTPSTPAPAGAAVAASNQRQENDPRSEIERQPYEFDRCTVQIAIQLLPQEGQANSRPVLIGVRTHLDAPLVKLLGADELGALPPAITALVEQLKSELPAREQATKERVEKEKMERLQKRLKAAKPPRHSRTAPSEKLKTVQTAAAPAKSVLTANHRANAVNQAADEKQQLAMF